MIAGTIWNQLVTTLQGAPTLSYIKYVFEGRRFNIEPNSLPCIMLEPVKDGETEKHLSNVQDVFFEVNLFAFSSNNFNQFPKTIVGDQSYKGILDIKNDIQAVLLSSYSLGDIVFEVRIDPTLFDQVDMEKFPARGLLMPLKILYRQINGV